MIFRVLGALYLTAGCAWAWRWTSAFGLGRWRATTQGLREHGAPIVVALPVSLVLWLYDGIAEIAFWPFGVRREWRFRKWLKDTVPPRT